MAPELKHKLSWCLADEHLTLRHIHSCHAFKIVHYKVIIYSERNHLIVEKELIFLCQFLFPDQKSRRPSYPSPPSEIFIFLFWAFSGNFVRHQQTSWASSRRGRRTSPDSELNCLSRAITKDSSRRKEIALPAVTCTKFDLTALHLTLSHTHTHARTHTL